MKIMHARTSFFFNQISRLRLQSDSRRRIFFSSTTQVRGKPHEQEAISKSRLPNCDPYWVAIQSKKKLPYSLQESLTDSFAAIPVSSFSNTRGGVVEIPTDTHYEDAVKILSESNIKSAPVHNTETKASMNWRERYLGIMDYSFVNSFALKVVEVASIVYKSGLPTTTEVSLGAPGGLGGLAMGVNGPVAVAGKTAGAVSSADFHSIAFRNIPEDMTVNRIMNRIPLAPFVPVATDSSMLSVLLLFSKYRLRGIPITEAGEPFVKNFITNSTVVKGLEQCKGNDWFDSTVARPISDFGLPFMQYNEVVRVESNEPFLEAFKRMEENRLTCVPVVEGPEQKLSGNISISDIRYLLLKPEDFYSNITVMEYINTTQGKPSPVATYRLDSSLGSIIEGFSSQTHIHVVAGEDGLVGVITLQDVISSLITEPHRHFNDCF